MSTGRPKTMAAAPGLANVSALRSFAWSAFGSTYGPPNSYLGLDGAMIGEADLSCHEAPCPVPSRS